MQQRKLFKIFFGLPASVFQLSIVASQHFNSYRIVQQKASSLKFIIVLLIAFLFIVPKTKAQTTDTTYVDTVSMTHTDSILPPVQKDESADSYDDNDDGYVDTTVKHIYDTSQYFFNWKQYLTDTYSKEKIAQRHLIDKSVDSMKSEEDFWYIPAIEKMETRLKNDPKYRDSLMNVKNRGLRDEQNDGLLSKAWFNSLLWIIIISIFLAAVIYFLMQNKINLFSRSSRAAEDEAATEEDEDIFHLSYTKLIQKAEKDREYRVAIRLMFLQILKSLSDTNAIQYQADFTNLHYLQQLRNSKYYSDFSKISRNYEYAWYGKFDISEERYALIKSDFIKLQNKII